MFVHAISNIYAMIEPMYENLKDNLPHGAIKKISDKLKVHPSTVYRVMTGRLVNHRILEALIKEADRYASLRKKAQSL